MKLLEIYNRLLGSFGPQGWWPVRNGFDPPEWEVCVGAILTQNTNWRNVERALENMRNGGLKAPESVMKACIGRLEEALRPSGFYRQKAARLKTFAEFVMSFGGFGKFSECVTREQLLNINGIGPETADSILLYAIGRPHFVIDAYTRRIFSGMGVFDGKNYDEWRGFFESGLPRDAGIYKEFHALIVAYAKSCSKNPARALRMPSLCIPSGRSGASARIGLASRA